VSKVSELSELGESVSFLRVMQLLVAFERVAFARVAFARVAFARVVR